MGIWKIILILLLILILFGAGKLPKVMGELGKGLRNFKKSLNEEGEDAKNTKSKTLPPKKEHEQNEHKDT